MKKAVAEKSIKEELRAITDTLSYIVQNMATKTDLEETEGRIRADMATKEDLAAVWREMATKEDIAAVRREMATKEDLKDCATKADLEKTEERIMSELRPMSRTQDKDAVTIIDHERRIAQLERASGVVRSSALRSGRR